MTPTEKVVSERTAAALRQLEVTQVIEYPTPEQRFCRVYARKTPMIPFHNGQLTYAVTRRNGDTEWIQRPCLGCGAVAPIPEPQWCDFHRFGDHTGGMNCNRD